jgi:hypothetical protein
MSTYTVVIDSALSTNSVMGGHFNSLDYNFNWGIFPEGKYELTFEFATKDLGASVVPDGPVQIILDGLGTKLNTYQPSNRNVSGITCGTSQVIGMCYHENYDANHDSLIAKRAYNFPICLENLPTNNDFTVILKEIPKTNGAAATLDLVVDYTLLLHLKKI